MDDVIIVGAGIGGLTLGLALQQAGIPCRNFESVPEIRAIGVGLPYAVTVSIFGGTTDTVALWFKSQGHETWFYYYLTGMIAVSLVVYVFMRDTKAESAMSRHE